MEKATNVYEIMKEVFKEELGMSETVFNSNKVAIERSPEWLILAVCLSASDHPYAVRKAAHTYATKLLRQVEIMH